MSGFNISKTLKTYSLFNLVQILVTLLAAAPALSAFIKQPPASASPQQGTQERIDPNLSFKYKYRVEAPDTGDEKSHQESLKDGVLVGKYSVVQPDGTLRTVSYRADDTSGFRAKVQFQEGYADPRLQQRPRLTQGSVTPLPGTSLENPHDDFKIGSRLVVDGKADDAVAPPSTLPHTQAQDPAAFTSLFVVGSGRFPGKTDTTQAQGATAGLAVQDSKVVSGAPLDSQKDDFPSHTGTFGSKVQQESVFASGTFDTQAQRKPTAEAIGAQVQRESTHDSGTFGTLAHRKSTLRSETPNSRTQVTQQESIIGSGVSGAQAQQESGLGTRTSTFPFQPDTASLSGTFGSQGSVSGEGISFIADSPDSPTTTLSVAGESPDNSSTSIQHESSKEPSSETDDIFDSLDASTLSARPLPPKFQLTTGPAQQSHRFGSSSSGRTSTHNVHIQSSPFSGVRQAESKYTGRTSSSFSSSSSPSSSSSSSKFSTSSVLQLSREPDPFSATYTEDRVTGSHIAKKQNLDGSGDTVELAKHAYDDHTYTYRLYYYPSKQ